MRYVIIDLEATCWEGVRHSPKMAIIEIGAVCLASHGGPVEGEFGVYVRPVVEPTLSDFCRNLTSIRQEDVDGAELFGPVLGRFNAWLGSEPYVPCSWGAYDLHQLQHDSQQHGVPLPAAFAGHINLKKESSRLRGVKSCGMRKALEIAGIPLTGIIRRQNWTFTVKIDPKDFRVSGGKGAKLKTWPTDIKPLYKSKMRYKEHLDASVKELSDLQHLLYASNTYAVLLIFQAMDAAGKDGAINHVLTGVHPQGCDVHSFKHPSAEELGHDFLWRTTCRLPARGIIGVFNRSYYEEVLVVREHLEMPVGPGFP